MKAIEREKHIYLLNEGSASSRASSRLRSDYPHGALHRASMANIRDGNVTAGRND
jgi:hypothetical protein